MIDRMPVAGEGGNDRLGHILGILDKQNPHVLLLPRQDTSPAAGPHFSGSMPNSRRRINLHQPLTES
jgi:hypothetical protein